MKTNDFTVLIADDSILTRKQLKDVIVAYDAKINVIEASNGQEAYEQYKLYNPNLVFLDIVMPVMNGISSVRNIMEYDDDATIIIVSSVGTQDQLKEAIQAGARDFIQKPFSDTQVQKILTAKIQEG